MSWPHFNSHFYLKASANAFEFDAKPYTVKHLVQRPRFVFLASNEDVVIREMDDVIEIEIGFPSLSYAKIRWFEKESKLEIGLDDFGLQSVFFYESGETVSLSNRINTLATVLPGPEVSARDMAFYLVSGFLPTGWTFWKHIHRVAARSSWNLREKTTNHEPNQKWMPTASKSPSSVSEVTQSIREGLDLIHQEVNPTQLRISGGADTRIVSYLWNHPVENVSVRSPWMSEGQDQDVNLAAAWSKFRGVPYRTLVPDPTKFAFFAEPPSRPMLTGLCGGEFLGGQFNRVIPSGPSKWDSSLREYLSEDLRDLVAADAWYQDVARDHDLWLMECARVFSQSARSTIYGSLVESWTVPCEIYFNAVSPFVAAPFLECFRKSIGTWGDYEFYEKVFRSLGPDIASVPLSSQFTLRAKDLEAGPEWGVEPKSAKPKTAPSSLPKESVEKMVSVMRINGVDLSFEKVARLLNDSPLRTNARSLYNWIDVRFDG